MTGTPAGIGPTAAGLSMSSSSSTRSARMRLGPRLLDADRLDLARRLAQAGGVGHPDAQPLQIQHHLEQVARRARFIRYNSCIAPRQGIEQTRFAGIRRTEDDDLEAVADDLGGAESVDMPARFRRSSPGHRTRPYPKRSRAHRPHRQSRSRPRSLPAHGSAAGASPDRARSARPRHSAPQSAAAPRSRR